MSVATIDLPRTAAAEILRKMYRIRHFETQVIDLFQEGQIRGSTHTYIGMEGSGVGCCSALGPDDYITSTHRGHGHCIAKGGRLDLMMAELLGKATGYCKGKGGSLHLADGPSLLVSDTYRFEGHNVGDGQRYRSREEVERWRASDPIVRFRDAVVRQGLISEAEIDAIEQEVRDELAAAIEFAHQSPE